MRAALLKASAALLALVGNAAIPINAGAPRPSAFDKPPAGRIQAPTAPRPNIVVLLADDWGFSDVGSFGSEIHTPNIDALAAHGVRFANFHVAGSCSPTRAMLQTGVSNHRAGLGNMPETIPPEHVGKPGYETVLNDHVVTIAQRLRDANYRTYFSGKWHLGKTPEKLPGARGYDRAVAMADAGADNFEQKPIEGLYDKADWSEDGKPINLPSGYYSSTFIVDKMIGYIDSGQSSGKPFFASVNFLANHIPVQAPDAYLKLYAGRYQAGWTAIREERRNRAAALGIVPADTRMVTMGTTRDWRQLSAEDRDAQQRYMAAYGAMAEAADHEIGRLIDHLKSIGQYDNTIFVFLSDNGAEPTDPRNRLLNRLFLGMHYDFNPAHAGQRGTMTYIGPSWASAAASPLNGYKFSAGEGGLRVPLIIAWPGNPSIKPGRIADRFAYVTDIAPTLLSLAGAGDDRRTVFHGRPVEPMSGMNLAPVLTGQSDAAHDPAAPLGYELSGNAALFKGDYKLVKNLPPTGDGAWRLFDIVRDPGEVRDLSRLEPQRFADMKADYAAYAKRDRVLPMPPGYTADKQINANAMQATLFPKLRRLAAIVLGLIGIAAILLVWRRWRLRQART
jgi:arylsulfatase/uncharacterized sulfatase